ncbi:MAG: YlbG family protein [Bacillaceae bacterium]
MAVYEKRQGIVVYLQTVKYVKMIRKFGNIHYVSKRLKYVVMYVDGEQCEEIIAKLNKMNFVKKVELSYKADLKTEFESKSDKAKEYDYKMEL